MNPSSHRMKPFIQPKLFLVLILGLIFIVPMIVTAQETTEEPQVDPVVTEAPVEETVAPTEETPQPTEATEVVPEETVETPAPEATDVEEDTSVQPEATEEPTDEELVETTEEPTVDVVETEASVEETDVVDEETPVEITAISEDFEAWTGEYWTIADWSVAQVDDSLALVSTVADATAQVISLDWTNYSIALDVKVETGSILNINVDGYTLAIATDGRSRLSQNDTIIATSPPSEVTSDTPTWHSISLSKIGTTFAVTVDDTPHYTVETTTNPLGIFAFVATSENGVAIDNLEMAEIDESDVVEVISTPTPEANDETDVLAETTEEPDALAETTEEPDAEATEEPDAEATEEPDAEATEEPNAEATEEPVLDVVEEPIYVATNLITDGFEGDLSAWNTTASIVEVAEGNHVLLLGAGGQLAPATPIESDSVVIAGQASILNDVETAGSFTVAFDTYTIEISTTGVTISSNGEIVAVAESAQGISTWFNFVIEANTNGIIVTINDVVVAEYAEALAITGNFVVTTNTSTMFEDITVDSIGIEEPLATPTPEVLTAEAQAKLGGIAQDLMNAYLEGGDEAVAEYLVANSTDTDEMGRVLVDILAAETSDGETVAQLVTETGGEVTRTFQNSIEAYVDVSVIIGIAGNENVRFLRNVNRAASTGPVGVDAFGDERWTEGFNLLSAHEWHLAGVTGQDVKVGVVDIGFSDADSANQRNENISCLADTTPLYPEAGGLGTSVHGTEVIEVICDLAPDADVYMFRADSADTLQEAISEARNPTNRMDILIIALDLGVNTSAGGGISGNVDDNVYGEIEAAKDDGMVIIVAAGNNNKRMLVLEIDPGAGSTQIDILNMETDDVVKFGWNDYNNAGTVATIQGSLQSGTTMSSDDPDINPMSVKANADGDLTLTINPTINQTTYLQVQIVPANEPSDVQFDYTSIALVSGTSNITDDDNVGNLGRPADSDDVISVGAICTRTSENPTRWEFSSNGPRFNANGTPIAGWDEIVTQAEAKPTLMSYSFVSTRDQFSAPEGDAPVDGLLSCSDGFGGTSAAAAHVAGMAALVMSNDGNTSFDDLNEANANNSDTFEGIRDYLQARSVDLPLGAEADGYDTDYGSGLAILGAPSYDLNNTKNLSNAANLLPDSCDGTNTFYVGQASMDNDGLDGAISTPFTSIAAALNINMDDANPDPECVIVMPGEYVTPIFVERTYVDPLLVTGYSDVSRTDVGDVYFWLRGLYFRPGNNPEFDYESYPDFNTLYRRRGGLYFGEDSGNAEFSGFTFIPARVYSDTNGETNTSSPSAVIMDGSTDTTISNSQFGKITINEVTYPGWDNINATPIQILNSAEGARVANNKFNENSVNSVGFYPTVAVVYSGAMDNPVTIINNELYGNRAATIDVGEWSAILYAEGSHVDIINNAIYENEGDTIIKIATTHPQKDMSLQGISPTHDRRARIVGNVFLNNTTISDQSLKQPGALINARHAPMMYIINNTIVGNTIPSTTPFGELFSRGNADSGTGEGVNENGGSNPAGWDFWEIHNNLIYDNTFYQLVGDTEENTTRNCFRIPNDVSNDLLDAFSYEFNETFVIGNDISGTFIDRGAQNNWIVGNTIGSNSEFGDCQEAIKTDKNTVDTPAYDNQNIIDDDGQPVHVRSSDDLFNDDEAPFDDGLDTVDTSNDAQNGDFQGLDTLIEQPYTVDNWQYYALVDTYVDPDNNSNNEYSDGIDAAGDDWLTVNGGSNDLADPYMDNAEIEFDIIGTKRPLDVSGWEISWLSNPGLIPPQGVSGTDNGDFTVDIGAFEYSPLQFETQNDEYYDADLDLLIGLDTVPAVTDELKEDLEDWGADFVTFDLSTVVTGGFGNLHFEIQEYPNNYGEQCGSQFENQRGLVIRGNGFGEIFDYCPPPNFYTNDTDSATNNDFVSFIVSVEDEAGASVTGEVRFTIGADEGGTGDDSDFSEGENADVAIGDEEVNSVADESDLFEVVTTLGADVNIRLRPYVRFGNFFFSENGNAEYVSNDGRKLVEYPFSYQIDSITDPDSIIESTGFGALPAALGEDPVINISMSDSTTGVATISYTVTDDSGSSSSGNILTVRSVSIVPDEGLHDDTSFIWNYSDDENAEFFTEINGYQNAEAPISGDWIAERELGAINNTLHTTSTEGDTATFRFIGTGFTIFMRGGDETTGKSFALKVFDDLASDANDFEVDLFSLASNSDWAPAGDTINRLEIDLNDGINLNEDVSGDGTDDLFICTTRAGIDTVDAGQLVHDLDVYTITCDGLTPRTHTVQIINTDNGTLSVDAFSIINGDLNFADAGPIPPGFHDVDNGVLRNAFGGEWQEAPFNEDFSNGFALEALVASPDVSFTIADATGFAIGTTYRNEGTTFSICVNRVDPVTDGVCTTVKDDVASEDEANPDADVTGIHIPFFGLDPDYVYNVTLTGTGLNAGFIFDDLVVFGELMQPTANLPLGETYNNDIDIILGEPFSDDWVPSDNQQIIDEDRSPVGPFVAFQMDDDIDTIAIKIDNIVPAPECPRRGVCPEPPPSGLSALAVCVNRDALADSDGTNFSNCIIVDTQADEYDFMDSTDGSITPSGIDDIPNSDGTIFISEDKFDAPWGDNTNNTVEIFSLHPNSNIEFTSVILFSTESGLGEGSFAADSPGIFYVEFDRTSGVGTYSEVEIDDDTSDAFTTFEIKECVLERRGVCQEEVVLGTTTRTTGIGNAVIFKMQGTGLIPQFTTTNNTYARVCIEPDGVAFDGLTIAEAAVELQTNGDCQMIDLSSNNNFIFGIESVVQYVMIELIPSPTNTFPIMNFDGVKIINADWESLTPLTVGSRYETSYSGRFEDNQFAYNGSWSTKPDTNSSHSGSSYDETENDAGATITFQVDDANAIAIIRDLQTEQVLCDSRSLARNLCEIPNGDVNNVVICNARDKSTCPQVNNGFAPIKVCVAPTSNPNNKSCVVHNSSGNATQSILPISLNDDFSVDDYVISITSTSDQGFVIDAIDVFDTSNDKMTVGIYQENSSLIAYEMGQMDILKNTGFETTFDLLDADGGDDWDWGVTTGVSATITAEDSFVGSQSVKVDADDTDALVSEQFNVVAGERYTVVARVKAISGTVEMQMNSVGNFVNQSTESDDKWELLRYSFEAASSTTDQLEFVSQTNGMTFFVDDVHVYKKSSWTINSGGLTDRKIATSMGYGAKASFMFNGTGFTIKLASDKNSGEARVCYDDDLDMSSPNCFTYDDEQPTPAEVCTGTGRRIVCTTPSATNNNGHTVVGLDLGNYIVSIEQMDNGLRTAEGPEICTGVGRRIVCEPGDPPNSAINTSTTIKLDYVEIFDNDATPLPVADGGIHNEDAIFNDNPGMQLFPNSDWSQVFSDATAGFSDNSYYQVSLDDAVGSLFALKVDNTEPATVVIDINKINEEASYILACSNVIEGVLEFNGSDYDLLDSSNCAITSDATQQTQLVFNQNNLPNLDGVADDETTITIQSLTDSSFIVDGYQILYGQTLSDGYYEESIGYGVTDSILTLSSISGTDDWDLASQEKYSGNAALATSISGTSITFDFEGTGVSLLMGDGVSVETCARESRGVCVTYQTIVNPLGKVTVELDSSKDGADICDGSCHDAGEIDAIIEQQVEEGAITIAGLPYGVYTVKLTAFVDETLNENVVLDAIEVFGTLQQLGSLYDNAQVKVDGSPLLTFGPRRSTWTTTVPNANGDFLNDTYHMSLNAGASVSFEVGALLNTEAIIIYDGNPALPDPVCTLVGRRSVCVDPTFTVPSSSSIEVCWSNIDGSGDLFRSCTTEEDLDDGTSRRRVDVPAIPGPGNYIVSITNKAKNEPLYIDAIQVVEEGLMTEGIYEEDHFEPTYSPITNTAASNDFVVQLDENDEVEFTFEGIAFSVLVVDNGLDEDEDETLGSADYDICVYPGPADVNGCDTPTILDNITRTGNPLSAVSYGGFHNGDGSDNEQWTVVITNNDSTNPLLIDRIDILGNNNALTIDDKAVYEAGEPQIRYLPFGSWVEQDTFGDAKPLNDTRFETAIPGSVAYFEFIDDGSSTVGIEYIRQYQDFREETTLCLLESRGRCRLTEVLPELPALADANICYGEVGDPASKMCESKDNGRTLAELGDDDALSIFQFGSSASPIVDEAPANIDCTNGCWGFIEYHRETTSNSLTPLDYVRLYDPSSALTAGTYQENHPNISDSGNTDQVADINAMVGFYNLISGTAGESYFYFPFEGTGFSVRTFAGSNAEDILLCVIDYTGGATPTLPGDIPIDEDCLKTYSNEQEENGFITRSVHGLDHNAEYMAIIKMDSDDGSTAMGLDQVTIFNKQWYTESDLSDATYLKQLTGGNSYDINFKTRNADKLVQFIGDWKSVNNQILVGYENARRKTGPIYEYDIGDRGFGSGTTNLIRVDDANAVGFDIELDGTGSFQVCAIPLANTGEWDVDIAIGSTCQIFTQTGRTNSSFIFTDTTAPHVITVELLTETWMSLYSVSLFDVTSGLGIGLYDDTAPGIQYDTLYNTILHETMEDETVDWDTIGSSTTLQRAGQTEVCVEGRRGLECTYEPEPTLEICVAGRGGDVCNFVAEPVTEVCVDGRRGPVCSLEYQDAFSGDHSRKVVANIGQGIEYVGSDDLGVSLDDETHYTITARVFINASSVGGVKMQLIDGVDVIDELDGMEFSTTTRGSWQTLRIDFTTTTAHSELSLRLVAINGKTTFFVDEVLITTGGQWSTATAPIGPDICTGTGRRQVCEPGNPVFDAYGGKYSQSMTPGASFTFDFEGTGFELGLLGGNRTGEVEVCYHPESDDTNPICFIYSQDDGTPIIGETCVAGRRGLVCTPSYNDSTMISGRGVAGLASGDWTVLVREIDDLYNITDPNDTRKGTAEECIPSRSGCTIEITTVYENQVFGLDYIHIFDDSSFATVPVGSYNEDAQDGSEVEYLNVYPENEWIEFSGSSSFTNKTYTAPADGSLPTTTPGPIALLQIEVTDANAETAIVFQFGGDSTGFTNTVLMCVDETSGEMQWDGTQFILVGSETCKLLNNVHVTGQASITSEDVAALSDVGVHKVTITALSAGNFRIDGYQVFDSRTLIAGLHNETLPATILEFNPAPLNTDETCDNSTDWCFVTEKTVIQDVCISFSRGVCRRTELQPVTTTPYIAGAATTAQSGAELNFVAQGTGFSVITDIADNGLDFRVCYKLESSDISFPTLTNDDEALNGFDSDGLPVLISEGGVLCELLTTDTDNWDTFMDRPLSSGAQYGFSFYGMPFATYEVQVMVTTPQGEISTDEWFTLDAINVFTDSIELDALQPGLTDDSASAISYEPSLFWDSNTTTSTYFNTDSTTDNAGAISQFRANGNSIVLYQTVGDMSSDIQICLIISNDNIHCSVEAERQTRLARQVTSFTQKGDLYEDEVCVQGRRGLSCSVSLVEENSVFTPVVFYGLGEDTTHKIILENREHGKTFNIDAIQVID